jgi:hypothetical protein
MDARAEFEALISLWDWERESLQAIIEDPTTAPEVRIRCIITLAKLVMKL